MKPQRLTPQQQKIQHQLDKISARFQACSAAGDFPAAMRESLKAHKLIPKAIAPLSDAASMAVKSSLWAEGIKYAKQALKLDAKHINAYDALSHAYDGLADWENCARYGLRALQLRDELYGQTQVVLPPIVPQPDGKKIISFSLFGASSAYCETAVMNAELCPSVYPGWVCCFYIDDSVPEQIVTRLKHFGAETVLVEEALQSWPATMWRFLAADDENAAYVVFRDADSVISQREAKAVNKWLAGGKLFHTMRDAGTHTELILAGLWGMVAGAVPDMRGKIDAYLKNPLESRHFADQFFLREHIWPYAKQSLCAHDRLFGFLDAPDFPETWPNFIPEKHHVGCNEGNSHIAAALDLPEGSRILWRLFTRISPLFGENYAEIVNEEERLVCSYETVVQKGELSAYIPRRYSQGVARGLTKVTVAAL
ncbi:MAG: hypothetical protein Q4A84_03620 [Neisseria sp.]|uniref:hypothetical protein n=1 Tax=Neisseria sp. TaxID=192066 RepID=UPI0026DC1AB6|nr:hypothetical protein [Neisseria sp.]MDO4640778.1 hypothetical protein [Neisseria sp.]